MVEKRSCMSCGSKSAPEGARFCPNCGASMAEDLGVPMAAAVPIEEDIPVHPTPSAPPTSSSSHFSNTPTATSTTAFPSTSGDMQGALYFKNPTPQMLQQANMQSTGGILFIQSPNYFKGKFTLAKTVNVGHILSGKHINLSYADFVHPTTTIYVGAILGGVKVIVPRGVRVETNGLGILGGFKGVRSQTIHAGQDGPLVVISGVSILGGVKVLINDNVAPVRIVAC